MIDALIKLALKEGASDIHLSVSSVPVFRVTGILQFLPDQYKLTQEQMDSFMGRYMTHEEIETFKVNKYHDSSFASNGSRFRAHYHYIRGKMACALRAVPEIIPKFDSLFLPPVVRTLAQYKNGLVLVTGTTGSGKTTTLASLISEINQTQSKHIITVEDPIEFEYKSAKCIISQKQVGDDVLSFSEAVRGAMREDPDIILLGEMRDLDTISNALTMAETGHLVFGTLHTKNAAETIDRIIDVFPPAQQQQVRVQLASTLRGVVGQTLVKKVNGGRVPLCEVMVVTDAIKASIRDAHNPGGSSTINDAIQTNHQKLGSQTYYQSAVSLMRQNLINFETASAAVENIDTLKKAMALAQQQK